MNHSSTPPRAVGPPPGNYLLRKAIWESGKRLEDIAEAVGVDAKTVERWTAGRVPHWRNRLAIAHLLGCHAHDLWPPAPPTTSSRTPPADLGNDALRRAMHLHRATEDDLAQTAGVHPRTVHRWLAGRLPKRTHRRAIARLLGEAEYALWPQLLGTLRPQATRELHAIYPTRSALRRTIWRHILRTARHQIDIVGDLTTVVLDDPTLSHQLATQLTAPATDDSPHLRLCLTTHTRTRQLATFLRHATHDGRTRLQLRHTTRTLALSILRADDDILVTHHLPGRSPADAPVLHLRRDPTVPDLGTGLIAPYLDALTTIWTQATPPGDRRNEAAASAPPRRRSDRTLSTIT